MQLNMTDTVRADLEAELARIEQAQQERIQAMQRAEQVRNQAQAEYHMLQGQKILIDGWLNDNPAQEGQPEDDDD